MLSQLHFYPFEVERMDQGEIGTRVQRFTIAPAIWNLEEHATVQSRTTKADCRRLSPVWLVKGGFEDKSKKSKC